MRLDCLLFALVTKSFGPHTHVGDRLFRIWVIEGQVVCVFTKTHKQVIGAACEQEGEQERADEHRSVNKG